MSTPHGTILGGLSTVPDIDHALSAYRDVLGLDQLELGTLSSDLASSWGCPVNAGSPYAVLRPKSGSWLSSSPSSSSAKLEAW